MATPDISRFLQQPTKHYVSARHQQGRVLTDADFNEGAYATAEDRRQSLLDLLGSRASPDEGFSLGVPIPAETTPFAKPKRRSENQTPQILCTFIGMTGVNKPYRRIVADSVTKSVETPRNAPVTPANKQVTVNVRLAP